MIQQKHNIIGLPNIKCVSEPLNNRFQAKTQAKRSSDYPASQDKEIMIKSLTIEYINIHKEYI
jgi:hypothetical protein